MTTTLQKVTEALAILSSVRLDSHQHVQVATVRDLLREAKAELKAAEVAEKVDALAQDIRIVDGGHKLGAAVLAEKLIELGWKK